MTQCTRPPGELALARALAIWTEDIIDPRRGDTRPLAARSLVAIDRMISGPQGLGWSSGRDGGKTDGSYRGNLDFAWCGAFAATCWAAAGLRADIRKAHLASTYRLDRWSRAAPGRLVAPDDLRDGDIVIVGRKVRHGEHIAIAAGSIDSARWFPTVEGNAHGEGPDGRRREGVVKRIRSLAEVALILRPLPEDLA